MSLAVALGCLCGLVRQRPAGAQTRAALGPETEHRPLILLIRQSGDDALMDGVRTEAMRFGWEVQDSAFAPSNLPEDTPVAIIRYLQASRGAHLWIRAAGEHAPHVEEWIVHIDGHSSDVLAIRVVEVLRAHFILVRRPNVPASKQPPLPEVRLPRATAKTSWGTIEVGVAGYWSPGGLDPMGGFVASGKIARGGWIGGVIGVLPIVGATMRESEGQARIRSFGAMIYVGRQFFFSGQLAGFAGLGTAVWAAAIQGIANPPYVSRSNTAWTIGPFATLGMESVLGDNLRLGLSLQAGVTVPPISIRIAEREAAQWGAPFGLLAFYGALQL